MKKRFLIKRISLKKQESNSDIQKNIDSAQIDHALGEELKLLLKLEDQGKTCSLWAKFKNLRR